MPRVKHQRPKSQFKLIISPIDLTNYYAPWNLGLTVQWQISEIVLKCQKYYVFVYFFETRLTSFQIMHMWKRLYNRVAFTYIYPRFFDYRDTLNKRFIRAMVSQRNIYWTRANDIESLKMTGCIPLNFINFETQETTFNNSYFANNISYLTIYTKHLKSNKSINKHFFNFLS